MTDLPGSPRAARLQLPGWLDARLVLGVLLVLVSVVAGAGLLSSADRSAPVWIAARDLAAGTVLTEDDLERGRARLFGQDAARYLSAEGGPPVGRILERPVGERELVPYAALAAPGQSAETREVAVPVAVGHLPPDLQRGQRVDVYLTPAKEAGGRAPAPASSRAGATTAASGESGEKAEAPPEGSQLVLSGVPVAARTEARGLGARADDLPVVLRVDNDDVAPLLAAVAAGTIDLVRVPPRPEDTGDLLRVEVG